MSEPPSDMMLVGTVFRNEPMRQKIVWMAQGLPPYKVMDQIATAHNIYCSKTCNLTVFKTGCDCQNPACSVLREVTKLRLGLPGLIGISSAVILREARSVMAGHFGKAFFPTDALEPQMSFSTLISHLRERQKADAASQEAILGGSGG